MPKPKRDKEGSEMNIRLSRRKLMQTAGVAALSVHNAPTGRAATMPEPHFEGKDTPKICLEFGAGGYGRGGAPAAGDEAAARLIRQLGVNYVISNAGQIPW